MRIDHLRLTGGAAAGDVEFKCAPGFNLIIGQNGAGKSVLLRALSQTLRRWPTGLRLPMLSGRDEIGTSIAIRGQAPDGREFHAREDRDEPRRRPPRVVAYDGQPDAQALALRERIQRGAGAPPPLLAHAAPDRPSVIRGQQGPELPPDSPLVGWRGAMDLRHEPDDQDWFKRPVGPYTPTRFIEAIRPALLTGLPDLTNIRWQAEAPVPLVEIAGVPVPWGQLPASYRAMIGLVGGLAWRAAVLTESWEGNAAATIGGVVLIESIEQHLHPRWQRRVVNDLRTAFPNVQFIATTHSPFIVQSMGDYEVINLDRPTQLDYQRSSIEDITEVEMGVHGVARSAAFQEKVRAARVYLMALEERPDDAAGLAKLKTVLDSIQTRFGADPVYVASLLQKRAARGIE